MAEAGPVEFDPAGGQSKPGEHCTVGVIGKPSPAGEKCKWILQDQV